jgi:hypothetical protein
MNALVDDGFVLLGGPLEDDRDVLLIVTAGSEAAVRDRLAKDPWQRSGMLTTTAIEGWTILLSPEILDSVLLPLVRGGDDAGQAPLGETGGPASRKELPAATPASRHP